MEQVVREAVEAMYGDYEALIADPAGEIDKWKDYGRYSACRLCDAVSALPGADKNPYYKHSCQAHCPLGPQNFKEVNACKKWPSCVAKKSHFDELYQAIAAGDLDAIPEVASKRLAWLQAKIG